MEFASKPSVSVIIPVYNVQDYLEDCLKTVISQDYEGKIECILVDDCSTDNSVAVAKQFISRQSSNVAFKIIRQQRNQKQSAARNRGMSEATGDFIYFLDSDDWIDCSTIRQLVELHKKHPDCQLVQAGIICTDTESCTFLDYRNWSNPQLEYSNDRQWIIDTCARRTDMIPMTPVNKLYCTSFLREHNIRFVEGVYNEDEIWLAKLAKHLQAVAFCPINSYHYRIWTGSTTFGGVKRHYNDLIVVWQEIMKLFDQNFCPATMLRQMEFDINYMYEFCPYKKVRHRLILTKWKLAQYLPLRKRLHIWKWIATELTVGNLTQYKEDDILPVKAIPKVETKGMISVIIPVYNAADTLKRCVESIQSQLFRNWEVLLIDDGSTDLSPTICDEIAQNDTKIKIYHTEHQGMSTACNVGLEHAVGEWITFIHPKDIIEQHYLPTQDYRAGLLVQGYQNTECKDQHTGTIKQQHVNNLTINNFLEDALCLPVFHCLWGKFYKNSIIDRNQIRFRTNIDDGFYLYFFSQYINHVEDLEILATSKYLVCHQDEINQQLGPSTKRCMEYLDLFWAQYKHSKKNT